MTFMKAVAAFVLLLGAAPRQEAWVVYAGGEGPGKGKHVVLVSGDEEYRSEEALPQLGKILAKHHGFKCTVLFAVDKQTGEINPNVNDNIPGLEALAKADLLILGLRFRNLPDDQMKFIDEYVNSGRPVIGTRTSTHAFNMKSKDGPYGKWHWGSKISGFEGGFGKQVLGETWVNHHGAHGKESCRGIIAPEAKDHPIVRGCEDVWGPSDVYTVKLPLPGDSRTLLLGQVLAGMKPEDKPVEGKKNDPLMPVAWVKTYTGTAGKASRIFTTTMGASTDLQSEGLRRLLVNASYWAVGMEEKIPARAKADLVGEYAPLPFKFNGFKKGVKPADHKME